MSDNFGIYSAHGFDVLRIAHKSNCKCVICGLPVNIAGQRHIDWNIEHYIPKAVAKWSDDLSSYMLRKLIGSYDNMFIAHPSCNAHKGIMYTEEGIDDLPISTEDKEYLHTLYDAIEKYTGSFKVMVSHIRAAQNNKCKRCGKPLGDEYTIRRINNHSPRCAENGMLLCNDCNESMETNSYYNPLTGDFETGCNW